MRRFKPLLQSVVSATIAFVTLALAALFASHSVDVTDAPVSAGSTGSGTRRPRRRLKGMHALPLVAVLAIGATAFTVGSGTSDGAETHGAAASPAAVAPSTTISPANEERAKAKALAAVEAVNDRDARVRFMNALAENQAQQQAAAAAAAEAAKAQQEAAAAAAQAQAQAQARAQAAAAAQAAQNQGVHGACGGNLPPCCVMMRESRGNPTAVNASSGASGKWQFMTSTWANYDGYPTAASAPESVQDERAAQVWAGGAGASHWGGGCW